MVAVQPTTCQRDPISAMLEVKNTLVAMLVCHDAMYSVAVHRIVLSQLGAKWNATYDPVVLGKGLLRQCKRIWAHMEYSRSHEPMGLPIMPSALILTYDYAGGQAAPESIIDTLNDLDSFRLIKPVYNAERIRRATAFLLGFCTRKFRPSTGLAQHLTSS